MALRSPRITTVCTLALFLGFLPGVALLQPQSSIHQMITPAFSSYDSLKQLRERFGNTNSLLLILENQQKALTSEQFCELQLWLQRQRDLFSFDILNMTSAFDLKKAKEFSYDRLFFPRYLDGVCPQSIGKLDLKGASESPLGRLLLPRPELTLIELNLSEPEQTKGEGTTFRFQVVSDLIQAAEEKIAKQFPNIKVTWGGPTFLDYHLKIGNDRAGLQLAGSILIVLILISLIFKSRWAWLMLLITLVVNLTIVHG
ncbi:MAG: hypothetical protein AAF202_09960, partial [Pseudomonadota bacterium]